MHLCALPLLVRLRRHRGLWLLAVAVVMLKLVAGTICLGDSPGQPFTAAPQPGSTLVMSKAETTVATADCLLGEAGDCHCTCAHSLTLPSTALSPMAAMGVQFSSPLIRPGCLAAMTGSQLRPPIA